MKTTNVSHLSAFWIKKNNIISVTQTYIYKSKCITSNNLAWYLSLETPFGRPALLGAAILPSSQGRSGWRANQPLYTALSVA